jgi:cytoskeletal protein RodZ
VQTLSSQLDSSASQMADQEPGTKTAFLAATQQSESGVPATNPPKSTPLATTKESAPKPSSAKEDSQGVKVGLTLKDASWIVISADGKVEFEGMLPSGTQRTWEAAEKLVVLAGNAGGVLLAINNGQAEQMGAHGQVIEREVLISRP